MNDPRDNVSVESLMAVYNWNIDAANRSFRAGNQRDGERYQNNAFQLSGYLAHNRDADMFAYQSNHSSED